MIPCSEHAPATSGGHTHPDTDTAIEAAAAVAERRHKQLVLAMEGRDGATLELLRELADKIEPDAWLDRAGRPVDELRKDLINTVAAAGDQISEDQAELQKTAAAALDAVTALDGEVRNRLATGARQLKSLEEAVRGLTSAMTEVGETLKRIATQAQRSAERIDALTVSLEEHRLHTDSTPATLAEHGATLELVKKSAAAAADNAAATSAVVGRAVSTLDALARGRADDAATLRAFGPVLDRHTRQLAEAEKHLTGHTEMMRKIGARLPPAGAPVPSQVLHEADCCDAAG